MSALSSIKDASYDCERIPDFSGNHTPPPWDVDSALTQTWRANRVHVTAMQNLIAQHLESTARDDGGCCLKT
jgi:hypothetical protein